MVFAVAGKHHGRRGVYREGDQRERRISKEQVAICLPFSYNKAEYKKRKEETRLDKINKEELMAKFGIEDEELLEKVAGAAKECRDPDGEGNCLMKCMAEKSESKNVLQACFEACSLLHCGWI